MQKSGRYTIACTNNVGTGVPATATVDVTSDPGGSVVPEWATIPTVLTNSYTITAGSPSSAAVVGNVTRDGGSTITRRGIVWGRSAEPILDFSTSTTTPGQLGSFFDTMSPLSVGPLYYVRAYAVNGKGTAYGEDLQVQLGTASECSKPKPIHYLCGDGSVGTLQKSGASKWTWTCVAVACSEIKSPGYIEP